jgi:hypothetical protein
LPPFSESRLRVLSKPVVTVQYMWIDESNANVIKVDFEALYHGDFLVEGDTAEQFPDLAEAV